MADRLPISGTAAVNVGVNAKAVTWTGETLTGINCRSGFPVVIEGVANFVDDYVDATHFTLLFDHTGPGGTGLDAAISPLTPAEVSTAVLNERTATLIQRLRLLDANGRGLFYTLSGDTGANDPNPTFMAFDADLSTPEDITEMYLDVLDGNNLDVGGLIELWEIGTVLVVRAIESNAYVSLQLAGVPVAMDSGSWYKVSVFFVTSDGSLGDGDEIAIEWNRIGSSTPTFGVPMGAWEDDVSYAPSNLVTVDEYFYMSLVADNLNHPPTSSPEPATNAYWMYIPVPFGDKFSLPFFAQGTYASGELLLRFEFTDPVVFPVGLSLSQASTSSPSAGDVVVSLRKNGVEFGTVHYGSADFEATFVAATQTEFLPGDVLTVFAPAVADITLGDISITLRGYREASLVPDEDEDPPVTSGTAIINFGSFPGSTHTETVVTGLTDIESGSLVQVWLSPGAGTVDHSVDEHLISDIGLIAHTVVAGVGFTIAAQSKDSVGLQYGQFRVAYRF